MCHDNEDISKASLQASSSSWHLQLYITEMYVTPDSSISINHNHKSVPTKWDTLMMTQSGRRQQHYFYWLISDKWCKTLKCLPTLLTGKKYLIFLSHFLIFAFLNSKIFKLLFCRSFLYKEKLWQRGNQGLCGTQKCMSDNRRERYGL